MLELDDLDHTLLTGGLGPAAVHAMSLLQRYGEAVGAKRFVSIGSAHIDGCLYHGPSSIDFIRRFVDLGGRVRVPTSLNVSAVDLLHPEWYPGRAALIDGQSELIRLHQQVGSMPTLTCAPYQRSIRPGLGEHVAWAESNAIVFANSVLGARTDRYGDFTDLCAALTGRVPYAGLHCDENRRATVQVGIPAPEFTNLPRDLYFACVGYALGTRVGDRVPVLTGLDGPASEDELKALGTAAAASGAVALFHIVGITPEAPTLDTAAGGNAANLDKLTISVEDLHAVLARLCPLEIGQPIAAVCLGTPHFSLTEFAALALALEGRQRHPDVEMYVSTSREIAARVKHEPRFAAISLFGVKLVVDTCTYVTPIVRRAQGAMVTNSAKWAHYAPGNLRCLIGLMTLERCIRSAETGCVAA